MVGARKNAWITISFDGHHGVIGSSNKGNNKRWKLDLEVVDEAGSLSGSWTDLFVCLERKKSIRAKSHT